MADISKINPNGTEYNLKDATARQGLNSKADKVSGATSDDFATLDSNGNLTDSGINSAIVPSGATSSNKLATANDIPTELNDLSDDVVITSPQNAQVLTYNSTSGKWENQAGSAPIGGAVFKGSILFTNIPTTGMANGDWYDIKDAFTTDSRFEEGAGIECTAGTDIIWVSDDNKWNILTPSGVNSFNGRLGAVLPQSGDYSKSDVGLGNVVNTGDSATPVSGGTTKFTTGGAYTELNKKADKVTSATSGNFAGLDTNGNLTDSGSKASDFSTVKTSESATSGGTTLSLVTTGEKYTWNNKVSKSSTAGLIKNDGTIDTTSYATAASAYSTGDTAETTLADTDYFPFYDTSATAKRKTLWSNIKSVLKTYFDGIYSTFSGSYNDLTNKPTIPSISNCYQSTDTAETTFADDDKVPFYDTSASAKRNSTWSNIKSVLKTYFDTLYTNNTGTVTSVGTGVGLTGGTITGSGTIKANLKSETASTLASTAMGSTSSRQYAVGVDKDSYLSVNIPWTDTTTKSASSNTSNKIYLIGTTSQSSSGVTTYSDDEVYTTDGVLNTKSLVASQQVSALRLNNGVQTGTGTQGSTESGTYYPTTWVFNLGFTPTEGDIITIKTPTAGTNYVWISIDNGTTYCPIIVGTYGTTPLSTQVGVGGIISLIYTASWTCSTYPIAGATAKETVTGASWLVLNFKDTTYSAMSQSEANTGTATSARTITAKVLTDTIKNKVTVAGSGTASTTAVHKQTITVAGTAKDIDGTVYMQGTATLSTTTDTVFTFTNSTYILSSSAIDVYCSIWGFNPSNVVVDGTAHTCTVTFPVYSSAVSLDCRIYIK